MASVLGCSTILSYHFHTFVHFHCTCGCRCMVIMCVRGVTTIWQQRKNLIFSSVFFFSFILHHLVLLNRVGWARHGTVQSSYKPSAQRMRKIVIEIVNTRTHIGLSSKCTFERLNGNERTQKRRRSWKKKYLWNWIHYAPIVCHRMAVATASHWGVSVLASHIAYRNICKWSRRTNLEILLNIFQFIQHFWCWCWGWECWVVCHAPCDHRRFDPVAFEWLERVWLSLPPSSNVGRHEPIGWLMPAFTNIWISKMDQIFNLKPAYSAGPLGCLPKSFLWIDFRETTCTGNKRITYSPLQFIRWTRIFLQYSSFYFPPVFLNIFFFCSSFLLLL